MFGRRKRVDEQLDDIQDSLVELRHGAELLHTVLVIREPDTVTAANAYEGLRKQIVAVAQEHWAHLAQLVEIDVSINHTDDIVVARGLVSDWMLRSGIRQIHNPGGGRQLLEMFDDLGGSGSVVEIRSPAYVDSATGRVIRKGRFARIEPSPPPPSDGGERVSDPLDSSNNGDADPPIEARQAEETEAERDAVEVVRASADSRPSGSQDATETPKDEV